MKTITFKSPCKIGNMVYTVESVVKGGKIENYDIFEHKVECLRIEENYLEVGFILPVVVNHYRIPILNWVSGSHVTKNRRTAEHRKNSMERCKDVFNSLEDESLDPPPKRMCEFLTPPVHFDEEIVVEVSREIGDECICNGEPDIIKAIEIYDGAVVYYGSDGINGIVADTDSKFSLWD